MLVELSLRCAALVLTRKSAVVIVFLSLALLACTAPAWAIVISLTSQPSALQNALVQPMTGIAIESLSVTGPGFHSVGTFTNASGTYGIGAGVALSTGDLQHYGDAAQQSGTADFQYFVAATASQNAALAPVTGWPEHFDTSHIDIMFDMLPGYDTVRFVVVFGSEEFPDFAGGAYSDGFAAYVNGTNVALVNSLPVNVKHPNLADVPGTILNGVLTNSTGVPGPNFHEFTGFVGNGSTDNTLRLILGDAGDGAIDSTVYIAQLRGIAVPTPDIAGDYNDNGAVDAADYVLWRKTDGTPAGYDLWRTHFGQTAGGGSSSNATVPEPTNSLLLILGAAEGFWKKRRCASRVPTIG